jgi:NAD(P)-dependent dehydrogenase (short-subunit alcohol dehydrogenase family)
MDKQTKIALITGGSRGLGKEMALRIAEKGIDIILTYHSQDKEAQAVVRSIEGVGRLAAGLQLDITQPSTFDGFVTRLKEVLKKDFKSDHFHFLINNAGTGVYAPFADTTEADFDQMMNMHVKAPFFLTQKSMGLISDGGRIINISTGLTRFSNAGFAAYATAKGAIETLTQYQAKELGARGIAVNVVAPGPIETDFGGGLVRDNKDVNQFLAGVTALGRVGLAQDIGGLVAFLCTEDARWINAQRIEASGGIFL